MKAKKTEGFTGTRTGALLERVARFYRKSLDDEPAAMEILSSFNLQPLIEPFSIGYASGKLASVLPSDAALEDELKSIGVLDGKCHERLQGCVTVPISDLEGSLVGFIGFTGHSCIFAGERPLLWNAPAIKRSEAIFVGCNIQDAMSIYLAEYPVTCVYPEDVKDGMRLIGTCRNIRSVVLVTDGSINTDEYAGLCKDKEVRVLRLRKSANAIYVENGMEGLRLAIEEALRQKGTAGNPLIEDIENGFKVELSGRLYEVRGIVRNERSLKASVRVESMGRMHVDTVDLYNARKRRQLGMDISRFMEEPAAKIECDISRLIKYCEDYSSKEVDNEAGRIIISEEDERAGKEFGRDKAIFKRILDDYEAVGLIGEKYNKLLCYLAAVSRKMDDPISVLILSSSGAGKSALQDATIMLTPPEDVVKLTSITGKALFYKGRNSIKHKLLALEEEVGAEEATYAIRNLISAKELVIEVTVKDFATGRMTTAENRVEGPTAVFITTTNPDTDPETRSRFFVTNVDESREQTRRILEYQRKVQTIEHQLRKQSAGDTARRHWAFQRQLKPVMVVNPFAEELEFHDDRLQGRRDQPKYLALLKAVAFLRQMQKKVKQHDGREYIEVDEDDLKTGRELANWLLSKSTNELNGVSRELLDLIVAMVKRRMELLSDDGSRKPPGLHEVCFSRREIREHSGWAHARIVRYLKELVDLEFLMVEAARFGFTYKYRLSPEAQGVYGGVQGCMGGVHHGK